MNDNWRTPRWLFDFCNEEWGPFDIDLAADKYNTLCIKFFDKDMDALKQSWHLSGEIGWCNPPYSNITPWLRHAINERAHGFATVMLLPSPNGATWTILLNQATELIFIVGRIAFVDDWGNEQKGNNQGSLIAVFKENRSRYDIKAEFVSREVLKLQAVR